MMSSNGTLSSSSIDAAMLSADPAVICHSAASDTVGIATSTSVLRSCGRRCSIGSVWT